MTNVLSLDDLQSSGNDGSNATETTSDSSSTGGSDDLEAACEAIGADYDHAKAYVDSHGNKDDLTAFAQRLANSDELFDAMADYRQGNCIHRMIRNWLRSDDRDFTAFTGQFYGNSDDPEPGTYNDVQQRSREMDGNLMFYQALFPSPVGERWDSDPVLWHEFDSIGYDDGQQDTHIFVPREFVEEYGEFSIEIDGESKPRPPANSELGGNSGNAGGSDAPVIDPRNYTIDDLKEKLQSLLSDGVPPEGFDEILEAERSGKDRKGAKEAIEDARNDASPDESDESDASLDDADISLDKVLELQEKGWTKEEILELA